MAMKNVIVTLADGHEKNLSTIVKSLEKAGLSVEKKFVYGVVTGKIDEEKIDKISKRKSIQSIAEEKMVQLPPGDSLIQ